MMKNTRKLLAALLLLGFSSPLQAQFGPSLRGAGMAGAYAGLARGHEALTWNPALLGLDEQPRWSFQLPAFGLAATMTGPDLLEMVDIMGKGTDVTEKDRKDLLGSFAGSTMGIQANGRGTWAGLSIGSLAIGVSTTGIVSGTVGKEMLDMMLSVRQHGDIELTRLHDYRVGNTTARGAVYTSISAAYGRSLDLLPFPASAGVTGRYIVGHSLQQGRIFEPNINLVAQDVEMAALAVNATGGSGYALDLGIAAQPAPWLTLSLAIENFVQAMNWNEELELRGHTFSGRDLVDMGVGELMEGFEGQPYDPSTASPQVRALAEDLIGDAHFPRVVRLGAGLQSRGTGTALGFTYSARQGSGELHLGWPKYAAVGIEQKLPLLSIFTLRGGYATSLDGASALTGGIGFGLGPIHLTTAAVLNNGHGNGSTGGTPFGHAEQMAAGKGVGFFIGLDLMSF